jgi:hypothetical protein
MRRLWTAGFRKVSGGDPGVAGAAGAGAAGAKPSGPGGLAALGLVAHEEANAAPVARREQLNAAPPREGDDVIALGRGLVASYPMAEGAGGLAADLMSGYPLRLVGVTWRRGLIGPALEFTGRSVAITPGLLDTSRSFTVSARVRLAGTEGWRTVLSQDGTQVSGFYLQYSAAGRAWAFSMMSGDSVKERSAQAVAAEPPLVGEWQHLAGVHDCAAGRLHLYVDGSLAAAAASFWPGWCARGAFVVGRGLFGAAADWFAGGIDQVQVWNRALSHTEATELTSRHGPV